MILYIICILYVIVYVYVYISYIYVYILLVICVSFYIHNVSNVTLLICDRPRWAKLWTPTCFCKSPLLQGFRSLNKTDIHSVGGGESTTTCFPTVTYVHPKSNPTPNQLNQESEPTNLVLSSSSRVSFASCRLARFKTKELSPEGKYEIWLYNWSLGESRFLSNRCEIFIQS